MVSIVILNHKELPIEEIYTKKEASRREGIILDSTEKIVSVALETVGNIALSIQFLIVSLELEKAGI
jgi:hypothetical protein